MDDQVPAAGGDEEEGGGGWIMTFADLISLLMCFFVLLLPFAEMDLNKFKAISGSLKLAFGVQREIKADAIPMGTSIIAQEFSPAQSQPTSINEVRQSTMDSNKRSNSPMLLNPMMARWTLKVCPRTRQKRRTTPRTWLKPFRKRSTRG
jgi:chemotaxis protein MotB